MKNVGIYGGLVAMMAIGCAHSTEAPSVGPRRKLFMDVHELGKVAAKDVAEAHAKDVAIQAKYGVEYKAYWVDEANGKVYCLVEAPSAEAARTVHAEAHGLVADSIAEVSEGR